MLTVGIYDQGLKERRLEQVWPRDMVYIWGFVSAYGVSNELIRAFLSKIQGGS
jgi:hypothetical protein